MGEQEYRPGNDPESAPHQARVFASSKPLSAKPGENPLPAQPVEAGGSEVMGRHLPIASLRLAHAAFPAQDKQQNLSFP
ncbi:hypothetical protein [Gemmobacter sp.]|uniref:hypothetical protein n=1 Tax=Gemmobacter sp. TaxID=1898957 RepID=UPI002AFED4C5|nr:hypothetical protein [Gemmobacter sp.]